MLILDGHKSAVYGLAFGPDGGRLAGGDREGNVLLWEGGEPQRLLGADPAGGATANALVFSPDGGRLVACTSAGWIDLPLAPSADGALVHGGNTTGAAFLGTGHLALGTGSRAGPEGGHLVLHAPDRNAKPVLHSAPKGVRGVSAAGEAVAWSEWGRLLYVWNIRKPDRVKLPLAAEAPCLALAPDGLQLAAGVDYKVKLFDVAGKRERLSLDGHKGRVTGVAFTPDGGTVVSGSWDGTVRLWDAASGAERATFRWPVGKVTGLAVSPDGLRLAVGGDAGAVVVADLD